MSYNIYIEAMVNFEWDVEKAQKNLENHRVSFELASLVFTDPDRVTMQDTRQDYGEERLIILGQVEGRVLVVVSTERESTHCAPVSFRHERPTNEKGSAMTTVKHTIDPKNPPKASKADLARLDAIKDDEIDYGDIPELDAEFWASAEIKTPNQKAAVTMRVDEETLEFFKGEQPKGYTARMAAVLKAYVKAQQPKQG